jgi:hypothetical protein
MLVKSQNKHNRMIGTSECLTQELQNAIENGEINLNQDSKTIAGLLTSKYEWDK